MKLPIEEIDRRSYSQKRYKESETARWEEEGQRRRRKALSVQLEEDNVLEWTVHEYPRGRGRRRGAMRMTPNQPPAITKEG